MESVGGGLSSIRDAKKMIALLSQQQYDSVKPLLATRIGGLTYLGDDD